MNDIQNNLNKKRKRTASSSQFENEGKQIKLCPFGMTQIPLPPCYINWYHQNPVQKSRSSVSEPMPKPSVVCTDETAQESVLPKSAIPPYLLYKQYENQAHDSNKRWFMEDQAPPKQSSIADLPYSSFLVSEQFEKQSQSKEHKWFMDETQLKKPSFLSADQSVDSVTQGVLGATCQQSLREDVNIDRQHTISQYVEPKEDLSTVQGPVPFNLPDVSQTQRGSLTFPGSKYLLQNSSLETLSHDKWLDDMVMNYCLSMMVHSRDSVLFLDSYLCAEILEGKRATKCHVFNEDLSKVEVIMGAYLTNNHWNLLVLHIPSKQLLLVDPKHPMCNNAELARAAKAACQRIRNYFWSFPDQKNILKNIHWTTARFNHPKQTDDFNCGVYVLRIAEELLTRKDLLRLPSSVQFANSRHDLRMLRLHFVKRIVQESGENQQAHVTSEVITSSNCKERTFNDTSAQFDLKVCDRTELDYCTNGEKTNEPSQDDDLELEIENSMNEGFLVWVKAEEGGDSLFELLRLMKERDNRRQCEEPQKLSGTCKKSSVNPLVFQSNPLATTVGSSVSLLMDIR